MVETEIANAIKKAHQLVAYQESEQSDLKASDQPFDALWQSIYDVCSLVCFGILDELLTEEEYLEGVEWLKQYQHLTKDYQTKELEF